MKISISGKWHNIKIPTGCYDIDSINTVLQKQLLTLTGKKKKEQHITLSANKNTLNSVLEIKDEKTVVDFDIDNSLKTFLGFEAKKYTKVGTYESKNNANILNVSSILVRCDIIERSCVNCELAAPVIYIFFLTCLLVKRLLRYLSI